MENNDLMEIFGLTEDDTHGKGQQSEAKGSDNEDESLDNSPADNEEGKDDNDLDDDDLGETGDEDLGEGSGEADDEEPEDKEGEESEGDKDDKKGGRSAKNAERRRQRNRRIKESQQKLIDEAVSKALKEHQEQTRQIMDAFVVSLGLKNPRDNKPITTLEELNEYQKHKEREQLEKDLQSGKITPEHIRKIVADMPELQRPAKEEKAPEEDPQVKAAIEADIKRISELDPSIKSIEDFVKMENHDRFYELVKRGNNFYDAFCLANMDKLVEMKAKAEARKRANLANSKEHMRRKSSRGQGAVTVPPDVMALYRELMPDATEAEIQKHYNKQLKK